MKHITLARDDISRCVGCAQFLACSSASAQLGPMSGGRYQGHWSAFEVTVSVAAGTQQVVHALLKRSQVVDWCDSARTSPTWATPLCRLYKVVHVGVTDDFRKTDT